MISVVLTKYKRPHYLEEQIESIKNQTIEVDDIIICDNSVNNRGVWQRFEDAKNAKNELICIFDDDTIPGPKFLENCYNEFNKKEGLYGTRGQIFNNDSKFVDNFTEYGWYVPNENTVQVDYVTHSWFFRKEWLSYYWRVDEVPLNYGEDMNFSFQLQKEGIDTFVPPHPVDDESMWGSTKGREYGDDGNGLWTSNEGTFRTDMFSYFEYIVSQGFRTLKQRTLL